MRESGEKHSGGTETGRETPGDREKERRGREQQGQSCAEGGEDRKQKAEARRGRQEDGEPGVMASETQLQGDELTAVGGPDPRRGGGLQSWRGKCRGYAGAPTGPAT